MVEKLHIEKFLELSESIPILDVRSPSEYNHAHIPGAYALPLFTDEERKIVGTSYKQEGRQPAIKIALDMFGVKMRSMIEQVEEIIHNHGDSSTTPLLVHCWRGGMRSAAVAWLLDLYGYKVYTLIGGYKSFRHWVLDEFEKEHHFKILGGYTGSAKTKVLHELKNAGEEVVDLEKLASHKGSAFGALGEKPQPGQEMFENLLALDLSGKSEAWVEDESQRIGKAMIPNTIWKKMRESPVYFLDIPFEKRLDHITEIYGAHDVEKLTEATQRIERRLGGLEAKTTIAHLRANEIHQAFSILLTYYDKLYKKGLYNRNNIETLLNILPSGTVDASENLKLLLGEEVPQNAT